MKGLLLMGVEGVVGSEGRGPHPVGHHVGVEMPHLLVVGHQVGGVRRPGVLQQGWDVRVPQGPPDQVEAPQKVVVGLAPGHGDAPQVSSGPSAAADRQVRGQEVPVSGGQVR